MSDKEQCKQCGKYYTHEEAGTYEVLNPICPHCESPTERDK